MFPLVKSILRKIEFVLFVSVVTGLIWLYAEGGNIKDREGTMLIQFVPPQGKQLLLDPPNQSVQLKFRCATNQFEQFTKGSKTPVIVEIDEKTNPQQNIDLQKRLQASLDSAKLGLQLLDVQPPTLSIRVESFKTVTMPVKVVLPLSLSEDFFVGPPTADPAKAFIKVPASLAKLAEGIGGAFEARINPEQLSNLKPNVAERLTVPLTLPDYLQTPGNPPPAIVPAMATVLVTVKTKSDAFNQKNLTIKIAVSTSDQKAYDIDTGADLFVHDITFTGPPSVIADIKSGKTKVWAELQLEHDEIEDAIKNGGGSKTPYIYAPPGVTFNIPSPVKYTAVRRPS